MAFHSPPDHAQNHSRSLALVPSRGTLTVLSLPPSGCSTPRRPTGRPLARPSRPTPAPSSTAAVSPSYPRLLPPAQRLHPSVHPDSFLHHRCSRPPRSHRLLPPSNGNNGTLPSVRSGGREAGDVAECCESGLAPAESPQRPQDPLAPSGGFGGARKRRRRRRRRRPRGREAGSNWAPSARGGNHLCRRWVTAVLEF